MTTKIRLTRVNEPQNSWEGTPSCILLARFCLLRTARKVGDEEWCNNYQLGMLRRQSGAVGFEIIDRRK